MATYTMELNEIISSGYDIFCFDYPIFDESYRNTFETKFKNHFFFREIGSETVARFIHYLNTSLNEIMPIYNKMYISQGLEQRILDNYDVLEEYTRTSNINKTGVAESVNKVLFSDTGRKRVDINDIDYISNISKDINNNTSNVDEDNTEKWTLKKTGNIGVQYDSDAIIRYESSLKNIDQLIFDELDNLFMQIY